VATDQALTALELADLQQVSAIVRANPLVLEQPGTGFILLAVLHLRDGRPEQAAEVTLAGARSSTPVQRQARIVNFRRLASAEPGLTSAVEPLIKALNGGTE
jgi:hypothetical protein